MWNEVLENFIRGEQSEHLNDVSKEITSGRRSVEQFVESIGTYLMSKEVSVRSRAVLLMAEVMMSLTKNFLKEQQVRVILEFLCARLLDHHSITPHTVKALLAMSSQTSFPSDAAVPVLTSVFKEVQVQTMIQVDRRSVYNLIASLLQTSLKELQEFGSEFVLGFLHAMDGEKDPRNLILVFNIMPTVINNFNIDMFIEEAFEVVACYFPVDFRPPPNDPYGVSREDLASSLRVCLSCTPKFAQFGLPMIMEKLSSDLQSARLDSYQLLQSCASVYYQRELMGFMEAVWSYCRKELMQGTSAELDQEALKTLVAMVTAVSTGIQPSTGGGGEGDFDTFLRHILTECRQHLCEPDHRMIHPCSKLLVAIATASFPACISVLRYALPLLLDQLDIFEEMRERMVLLDIVQRLVKAGHHLTRGDEWRSVFAHHADKVVAVILSVLSGSSLHEIKLVGLGAQSGNSPPELKHVGLGTLAEVVQIPVLVSQDNLDPVGQELTRILLDGGERRDVRSECIRAVSCLAKNYHDHVQNNIMTTLWTHVLSGKEGWYDVLSDMADIAIGTSDDLCKSLATELLKEIGKRESKGERHLAYLSTLQRVSAKLSSSDSNLEFLLSTLVHPLLRMVVSAALLPSAEAGNCPHCCADVLVKMADVMRTVVPNLDRESGSKLCQSTIAVFLHGELTELELTNPNKLTPFNPLKPSAPVPQAQLITVVQPIVCGLRKDVEIASSRELLICLLHMACHSPVWLASTWAAKALAGVINKHPQGPVLDGVLGEAEALLSKAMSQQQEGLVRHQALMAWTLLTKALVMRSHPKAGAFLGTLLQLLGDAELGEQVPQCLGILLEDSEHVLNAALHADIKLMYKQRVFLQALPAVMALFQEGGQQARSISALCHLLPSIPRPVLLAELPPIVPRLLVSLRSVDPRLVLPILDILQPLIAEGLPAIVSQVDVLLGSLLQLCGFEPAMNVRIAALKCIGAAASLPHHLLFPHQKSVVRVLAARLDDPKRLVRREAVVARTKWILLQQDANR